MAVRENKGLRVGLLVGLRFTATFFAVLSVGTCTLSFAKKDIPSGLEAALRRHYKFVSARLSDTASVVLGPGTILTGRKEGILSFPESDGSFRELCPSEFQQNGIRIEREHFCAQGVLGKGKLLPVQGNVCVRAIDVNRPRDVVKMSVVTCDRGRRSGTPYYALVTFQFPKGSFATLTPENVEQAIGQVLSDCGDETPAAQKSAADSAAGCSEMASPSAQPTPASPSPASADPSAGDSSAGDSASVNTIPTAIAQGQSPDQVIAVLGQPTSVAGKGATVIYFYPNLKIVFVDGKVSQIEQI